MSDTSPANGGRSETPARKAQRRRILEAGIDQVVAGGGLTISIDHLNFEQIVKDSGVPRSTAYRLWDGGREEYFRDLILELAGADWYASAVFLDETILTATNAVAGRLGELSSLEGRRSVLEDAVRLALKASYRTVQANIRWRTYVALNAATLVHPDEPLRGELAKRLRKSEKASIEKVVSFYQDIYLVLGVQMKDGFDFDDLALAGASIVEGLALRRVFAPEVAERDHFRDGDSEPWSLVAVCYLGILYQMIDFVDNYDPQAALQEYFRTAATRTSPA